MDKTKPHTRPTHPPQDQKNQPDPNAAEPVGSKASLGPRVALHAAPSLALTGC